MSDRLGAARHRAVLEAKVLSPDGGGGFIESWETYALIWAALDVDSGAQSLEAGRLESHVRCRATIRRRSDVSINHRLRIGTRLFAIDAIEDDGPQSLWLTLICEEGAPT